MYSTVRTPDHPDAEQVSLSVSKKLPSRAAEVSHNAVEYELQQERAAALGRMGRRLDQALRALAGFDAARAGGPPAGEADRLERDELVSDAGEALWCYVVQREACGLRDSDRVMRELGVPREVQLRMGFFPTRRKR